MKIEIDTETRERESLFRDDITHSAEGFEIEVRYSQPAKMQFAGLFETVHFTMSGPAWLMLASGSVAFIATEYAKEAIKDSYKWLKSKFIKANEDKITSENSQGIEFRIRSNESDVFSLICIRYYGYSTEMQRSLTMDHVQLKKQFAHIENVIRPIVSYWAYKGDLKTVIIEGFIGPGKKEPYWNISIHNKSGIPVNITIS